MRRRGVDLSELDRAPKPIQVLGLIHIEPGLQDPNDHPALLEPRPQKLRIDVAADGIAHSKKTVHRMLRPQFPRRTFPQGLLLELAHFFQKLFEILGAVALVLQTELPSLNVE